ncbi:hypothetical protein A5705_19975 [Mycobacterium sp. E787]|nr:hypothetical protein A5705_19975 [Mycobacterium sp. E787]
MFSQISCDFSYILYYFFGQFLRRISSHHKAVTPPGNTFDYIELRIIGRLGCAAIERVDAFLR